MTRRLLIHAGYPKAASTTLQNGLFFKLHAAGEIAFVGRAWESDYFGASPNKANYKAWLWSIMGDGAESDTGVSPLASCGLSSGKVNLFSEGLFITNERHDHKFIMPDRLKATFGGLADQIDVMFVIRNQPDLIMSYYVQKFRKIAEATFECYLARNIESGWRGEGKIFNFHSLAAAYSESFGKDRVHILLFEDLVNDLSAFSDRIAPLLGVAPSSVRQLLVDSHYNKTPKASGSSSIIRKAPHVAPARGFRRLFPGFLDRVAPQRANPAPIVVPPLTSGERETIFKIFKESNRRLADTYRLDTQRMMTYGYF